MKFRVGYAWVKVKVVKGLKKVEDAVGLWTKKRGSLDSTIKIDNSLHGLYFCHTLMHEFGHVAEHISGFDLKEEQIDAMSRAYTEFLFGSGLIDPDEFEARVRSLLEPK